MSGFSFPPPPPPPPKVDQPGGAQQGTQYSSETRGRGRGRYQNQRGQRRGDGNQFANGDRQHDRQQNTAPYGHSNPSWPQQQPRTSNLPPGAYVNPNFVPTPFATGRGNSNAGSNHANARPQLLSDRGGSPSRTVAGHKRKLEALRGPVQERKPPPPTPPSIPSFGVPLSAPPSRVEVPHVAGAERAVRSKSGDRTKSLGLVPTSLEAQHSSSESEDDAREVDEEAMYAELGDKLTFEHNGVIMSLTSQADLADWKKERQKKWPTNARMREKEETRYRVGEERKRLLAGANLLNARASTGQLRTTAVRQQLSMDQKERSGPSEVHEPSTARKPESELEKMKKQLSEQTKHLEALRKKVADSEARNRETQRQRDLNDSNAAKVTDTGVMPDDEETQHLEEIDGSTGAMAVSNVTKEAAPDDDQESSKDSSSVISSDSASEDSDEAPPEEVTSKPEPTTAPHSQKPVCRYFAASGHCRDGDACRFRHERSEGTGDGVASRSLQRPQQSVRPSPRAHVDGKERKSIHERLVEQEQGEADRLALKVIKYLGGAGFFNSDDTVAAAVEHQ
ncbi:hypothetical protein BDY17DRAFT_300737 [Neohortaea acidophila]|uniref:C3H1-type domain-containing protein n=1 Tax=Neohortaea acidophila TaxID=245834 RepID=A0A6A6PMS8_9PEZI|nr:uncharacterized protein BDY17DRAFT_300737 [Neohortaea acidophila]KAF2481126.1 hypothetical protein BDY17DRAFT_300737 [Neohortaea acidophila]